MFGDTPQAFYSNIPPVSKILVTGVFLTTMFAFLGIFDPSNYLFMLPLIIHKFEVFFNKISFGDYFYHLYLLVDLVLHIYIKCIYFIRIQQD